MLGNGTVILYALRGVSGGDIATLTSIIMTLIIILMHLRA